MWELSLLIATYLFISTYIIKICLRVSKFRNAQDFRFRGDNYTTNKVRVVSLTHNTPISPPLHPYQILSNYLKHYGSYGLHKISALGEITILGRQWELSLLHATHLLVLLFIPTKHYQNMSKGIKVMEHTRMSTISAPWEITNKGRVVPLAWARSTGPSLHAYQIWLNYLKQYGSYGLQKILASGEITI